MKQSNLILGSRYDRQLGFLQGESNKQLSSALALSKTATNYCSRVLCRNKYRPL